MSEQNKLDLEDTNSIDSVDKYKFEPIKGYPMLHWHGKRPFTSTQYYPAQKKEVYGEEVDGWINKIFWGDNLQVMSHLLKEFRGKIDLIYIDPPFDSRADYKKRIKIKGKSAVGDASSFEEKQYNDIWNNDEYLQFIYERLILCRELLSENGSFFLHCDWNQGHYLKIITDEIFGPAKFKNHIVWKRSTPRGNSSTRYPEISDFILFYTKGDSPVWNNQYVEYTKKYTDKYYNQIDDETGRFYQPTSLLGHEGVNPVRDWKGISKPWRYPIHRLDELNEKGLIYWPKSGGIPRYKRYLDEQKGIPVQSLWDDIPPVNSQALDDTGYPTQKPEKLIERIIKSCTNINSIVFDCFMGSGTTQVVAQKNGRRFIGADINLGSIQTTTKRLNEYLSNKSIDTEGAEVCSGFEVYNVNNYDIFRNPAEAKELLLESLEIESISGAIYDGEKDGFMVKVMPVNRIATREDLNELISNFPYKVFEKRKEESPNKSVESIMLICMGHEPDLKAHLEQECGYKLNVEVVDILRDKSNIQFKRDAESLIEVKDNKLEIMNFFPMNLMQKLSLQKESVSEWRELVEQIVVDWNYSGAAMEPSIIDIPGKNDFVKGVYDIPGDAGTIKIKITDLLSESYEEVIKYG